MGKGFFFTIIILCLSFKGISQELSHHDIGNITQTLNSNQSFGAPPQGGCHTQRGVLRGHISLNPKDPNFYDYPGGNYLKMRAQYKASSAKVPTKKMTGMGSPFGEDKQLKYCKLKNKLSTTPNFKMQWVLRDLDNSKEISTSLSPHRQFYGASLSKIFVAGAYLDKRKGKLNKSERQELLNLIVKSNNSSWKWLQRMAGDKNNSLGQKIVNDFMMKKLGIKKSIAFKGDNYNMPRGRQHGNEINAIDVSQFIQASYDKKYPGSEELFKTMFMTTTGRSRGNKYFPKDIFVGGKTGSYQGATRLNGKSFTSNASHHTMVFKDKKGVSYSLTIMSDLGQSPNRKLSKREASERVALLTGGLIREQLGVGSRFTCN